MAACLEISSGGGTARGKRRDSTREEGERGGMTWRPAVAAAQLDRRRGDARQRIKTSFYLMGVIFLIFGCSQCHHTVNYGCNVISLNPKD